MAPARPPAAAIGEVRALIAQQGDLIMALDRASMTALVPALVDARNELRSALLAWLRVAPDGDERYTAQQHRKTLLILQTALDRAAALGHDVGRTLVDNGKAAGELSIRNLGQQVARFGEVFGETVTPIDLDTAALLARGDKLRLKKYRTSAARYAGQVGEDIRHQFAVSVARNETFAQLKARLVRLGGPSGLVYTRGKEGDPGAIAEHIADGLFKKYRGWAERLVRTEMIGAYNDNHSAAIDLLNESRDADTTSEYLKRWDASLDKRICPTCADLDRRAVAAGGLFLGKYAHPPAHPNCRCVLVAWHASWGDIKGEIPAHGEATKAPVSSPPITKRTRPRKPKTIAAAPPPDPRALAAAAAPYDGGPPLEAAARGKWADARAHLERDIAGAEGYPECTLPITGHKDARKVGIRRLPRGVGGVRMPNGKISITPERAEAAQRFARQWTADAERARAALEGAAASLRDGKPVDPEHARVVQDAKCYRTLVHEVMHGHGPMLNRAYRGAGVLVEEVATEVSARRYMRLRYGMDPVLCSEAAWTKGMGHNPYGAWIDHATAGVADAMGTTAEKAQDIMERAADRYKRRPSGSVADDKDALQAFADDIAHEAGAPSAAARIAARLRVTANTRF